MLLIRLGYQIRFNDNANLILYEVNALEEYEKQLSSNQAHSDLQKRKSTLKTDGIPAALKPEDDFTGKEKYNEDEDNNNVGNTDEEKAAHDDTTDDHQEEGEFLLGHEDLAATKEELQKGLSTKDADDNKDEPSTRHFSHGCHLVKGKMDHGMEDYIFAQHRKVNGHDLGLYAIFDGHAGRDVAKYLQSHLFENILSEPDFWENPVDAIKRACKATDDEILENVADSQGGSTAVAAILINGVKLLVANVGDSRAVSCKNGVAKPLTVDHEPEKERDLVESRGGFVVTMPGNVPRVDGVLAMTRAFGDGNLKDHITAEPDVTIQKIDKDTEFIILASDGLWKVMENQEACDCIKDVDDAIKASKMLVKEAKSLGSYDDISCIVVMF
ncbi:hypothetical protein RIF29_26451 [Crotalaria pallida]|uniref:protein-serine/threonine phosphatase n=1 Tax=Crotalaria pallida TaxID=3830 RepID=A0AAN9EQ07_CROPI